MWIRLKSEKELLRESVDRLNYKVQLMEAVNELQNDIYGEEMYDEDTGKAMSWLKEKLQKVCPSPDKLKEFFNGLGKKMDAKVQGCKFDSVKNAWNSLKGMVAATDIPDEQGDGEEEEPQENPEAGDEMDAGVEGDDEEGEVTDGEVEGDETDDELAAESLMFEESMYEEGFWDSIKSGWNKLTGRGDEEPAPARGRRRKTTAKRGTAKKGAVKRGVAKKGTTKPGAAKKGTVKRGAKGAVAKKGTVKRGAKKGGKRGKQEIKTWKSKVWEFIKGHWKQIAVILIVCLALYFLGGWVAAMFAKSGTAVAATKAVTSGASKFKLPIGMTKLPPGAKLIGNGVVKFANGGMLAAPDTLIDDDF